jgi:hypothetical protein
VGQEYANGKVGPPEMNRGLRVYVSVVLNIL